MSLTEVLILLLCVRYTFVHGDSKKHYIVYMGQHEHPNSDSVVHANHEMLASVTGSLSGAKLAAIHHYSKSFRGFSATLTPEQAERLTGQDSVVSVFESRMNKLRTTHSWDFMGLNSMLQGKLQAMDSSSDVIVGVLDSGVWPESRSFSDEGLGPVPKKFKGECVPGVNFNCNRKIIGGRFYFQGYEVENGPLESSGETFFRSSRDDDGHGSHTASTIAGSVVKNVGFFGMAAGTSRGGAPNARLAIYKVCWFNWCSDADVLAALDDAINDGVDMLSLSLGPDPPQPSYFEDVISIGGFHAFRHGILVSAAAGNSGLPRTAANVAPWILTVAASTIDREFNSDIHIGNSKVLKGFSLNPLEMRESYELIAGSDAAAPGVPARNASFCKNNTLDHSLIKGKIVVCTTETIVGDNRGEKSMFVKQGGGVGMILIDPPLKGIGFEYYLPATLIAQEEAEQLQAYMKTEKIPVARISPTVTILKSRPAPRVAIFSSAGPNIITPDIIKPDITAPGVNILAAWTPVPTPSTVGRSVDYNIISGTSMSCPHVTGLAAIIKSQRPHWSPAAIKSAIMTTATIMDDSVHQIGRDPNRIQATPFDFGAGHINPIASLNPGLVYDFHAEDVIIFLCSVGASPAQLKNLTGELLQCPNVPIPSYNFNYPSIGVSNLRGPISVKRTVTYYGNGRTVYTANVIPPDGVHVTVNPSQLEFTNEGEKRSFSVEFNPLRNSNGSFVFGSLTWTNGIHRVRSPIGLNVISV